MRRCLMILPVLPVLLAGCHSKRSAASVETHVECDSVTTMATATTTRNDAFWEQFAARCSSITIHMSGDSVTTPAGTVHGVDISITLDEPTMSRQTAASVAERDSAATAATETHTASDSTARSDQREQTAVATPVGVAEWKMILSLCLAAVLILYLLRRKK